MICLFGKRCVYAELILLPCREENDEKLFLKKGKEQIM
jgi:hypothetical protein